MLSPDEFTIGKVGSAKPLSLVLPTNGYEAEILIGAEGTKANAVFLSGKHIAQSFECEGNEHWGGLIIPNVQVELDERSCVDTYHQDPPQLSALRTGTKLVVVAKVDNMFGRPKMITLRDDLASVGDLRVAFTKWQIFIGEDENKRILWSTE